MGSFTGTKEGRGEKGKGRLARKRGLGSKGFGERGRVLKTRQPYTRIHSTFYIHKHSIDGPAESTDDEKEDKPDADGKAAADKPAGGDEKEESDESKKDK